MCLCWTLHPERWYKTAFPLDDEGSIADRRCVVPTPGLTLGCVGPCFPLRPTEVTLNKLCSLGKTSSRSKGQYKTTGLRKRRAVYSVVNRATRAQNPTRGVHSSFKAGR